MKYVEIVFLILHFSCNILYLQNISVNRVHNMILHRILFINIVPRLVMERMDQFLLWSTESTAKIKCSGNRKSGNHWCSQSRR